MLIRSWRFVTILLVSLLLGLAFAHVLERPAKMRYDAALYITLQKTLYVAWGPPNVGGILEPAAILATISLAFILRKRKRAFSYTLGAGIALLLAFPVVFFWFVAPANEVFLAVVVDSKLFLTETTMGPNLTIPVVHMSHSDPTLRRLLGGMSIFMMLMTIPQVLTIWFGHQAAGVSILSWSAYLLSAVLWFWLGIQKHDKNIYLPCVGWIALDTAVIVGVVIYG